MNLTDLQTFSFVAETGTISGASKRLKVPKSTISRRIRRLEDALGHELLRRSPRAVTLTELGKVLHQRTTASLYDLRTAADAVTQADAEPTGTLRVTTTPSFSQNRSLITCLKGYGLRYPDTVVELELTNRVVNLVEEGLDIGLRLHTGKLPGSPTLMSRRLLSFGRAMYASPDYIAEMGAPSSPDELVGHRIAAHTIIDTGKIQWKRRGTSWGKPRPLPTPRWLINNTATLEQFALSGAGLAFLPTLEAAHWTAKGELVRVLPEFEQQGAIASLVWPSSRHLAPRVRAFIDLAVKTMSAPAS